MCDLTPDQFVTFSDSPLGPSEARSFVRQHSCPEHGTIAMDALLLITSELVTNAVRYGQPPIVLRLSCLASEVRLSVSDTGPELPREQGTRGRPGETGAMLPPEDGTRGSLGLGLAIVAKTSREWGITPLAIGKEVWSRVSTGRPPTKGAVGAPRAAGCDSDGHASPTGRTVLESAAPAHSGARRAAHADDLTGQMPVIPVPEPQA